MTLYRCQKCGAQEEAESYPVCKRTARCRDVIVRDGVTYSAGVVMLEAERFETKAA